MSLLIVAAKDTNEALELLSTKPKKAIKRMSSCTMKFITGLTHIERRILKQAQFAK